MPGLLLRSWPGEAEAVVHSAAGGRTHLVSLLAAEVLRVAMADRPGGTSLPALLQHVFGSDDAGADTFPEEDLAGLLARTVQGLLDVGLLRSVT